MKHSESIAALASALAKAQGALVGAKRNVANIFYDSKYADLASVADTLKACFPSHGLSYSQFVCTNEHGIGVETMLMHESGEWLLGDPFYLPAKKADAQALGSALSYSRRYSLLAVTGAWAEHDDDDAAIASNTTGKPITGAQVAKDAFDAMGDEAQAYIANYANEVKALFARNGDVMGYLAAHTLDAEEKLALWSLLPSNVRSAIKKSQQEMRAAS